MRLRRTLTPARLAAGGPGLEIVLRGLAVAGPDTDFQARLRSRLLAVSAVQSGPAAARPPAIRRSVGWLPRTVAAGAVGVVGVAGIGVATSRALPGQPLYGAKRQLESWQLAAASGHAERGREQLSFARTRMAEVEALAQHEDLTATSATSAAGASAARITSTLRRMDSETRAGTSDLADAARTGDRHAGRELLTFADEQDARLTAVAPRLPARAAPAVDTSRSVLRQVTLLARTLPGTAATPDSGPVPGPSSAPDGTSVRPLARPPGVAPTPAVRTPSTASVANPAAPRTLPTRTPVPSSSPVPTPPPTEPPSWTLPTAINGLLGDERTNGR
jgi:hypothetical protein